ncbi:uncharacterized protein LOC110985749 isoform X2 [Acanthaster planci]|nr:uncharacterized protein LOC110985749 isoform X2 [Acanthaster planci]XP_022102689.1 uncharacterized protein LOC110985749 isoform X2 [Acanthaster planci]XP_022102690.1 uncharacterized protein LOC110985749 isoform X2 [Acanthaster planci]XP_022102691.1 uncharacterized protein LOC110985749 isoform X2 [Acanthaster planci]XP_022102692.1 uncharacterized protein LOC110985749 isoform X2 [Acanthaster planci]XP_022102693.1 uncharacterized protein LOC110985749 isoform X2 [Acanthaster planci]XP_02210269
MNQFRLIVLLEVMAYTVLPNQAAVIQVCGNDLLDALKSVCGDRGFYSPPPGYSRRTPATQTGIATRCCISYCETSVLEKYCNPPSTSQSQTAAAPPRITTTPDERRANEIVVDETGQTGNTNSQMLRGGNAMGAGSRANGTKAPPTEVVDGRSDDDDDAAGEINTSERVGSLTEPDEETGRDVATNRPHKTHSKERSKNRTSKSERRRRRTNRRRSSSERRMLSSERKREDATRKLRRKEQRLSRKQPHSNKRKSKLEKKGSESVTTPVAVQTADHPFKHGAYNSTTGDLSLVNVTDSDTAPSSDTKKDGFFTTITAVLRDVIGFQHADDGNR